MNPGAIQIVKEIMDEFASITGLEPPLKQTKRYLWTDAFAVCNYLELYNQSDDEIFIELAKKLVDQVHHTLGRYREDDPRKGWISGLNEEEGERHPTMGGIRIGKKLNERLPGEPFDEQLEWERDGQYYHYLTKWMHALCRVGTVTEDPIYVRWAQELAQAAHNGFTYTSPGGVRRMYWKMSVDLTQPQVTSMGQQDPLDGYITYKELQFAGRNFKSSDDLLDLSDQIRDMALICRGLSWLTDDPLGIGGLLSDAIRLGQFKVKYETPHEDDGLLADILGSGLIGLKTYEQNNPQDLPAQFRLAFREMGLSIGIKGLEYLNKLLESNKVHFIDYQMLNDIINRLRKYFPLADSLENFWLNDENQKSNTWTEHREINMVMLATSLTPCGFLGV
jgi:hypothetical protein